jgi:hypothetical protein
MNGPTLYCIDVYKGESMGKKINFDLSAAHRYFSAECFNRAWDYIDKPVRTAEEDQAMLQLGLASLWHWTQRPDCAPTNLSIGYWQVARIYTLLGQVDMARQYGQLCLKVSQGEGVSPFYLGYAYEALARAESVAGDDAKKKEYLELANRLSEKLTDPEARKHLLADLATIR